MADSDRTEGRGEWRAAFRALPEGVRALLGPSSAAPFDDRLPECYGRTRLVLLVAGPYRVHAFWEVTPASLAEAETRLEGFAEPARAVLRVFDSSHWFDIDVDLSARHADLNLWRADVTCRAHLGLRSGERFVELARSNTVHTPRAWPRIDSREHFLRVAPEGELAETLAEPPQLALPFSPPADETPQEAGAESPNQEETRDPTPVADLTVLAELRFVSGVFSHGGK